MERIADVLYRKYPQFNTVSSDTTVKDALYKMYCENVDYLIIMEGENFVGLLTERDIASKVLLTEKPLHKALVCEFMTTSIPVATAEDTLEYGMQLLEHYSSKYVAVYDQFTFKGIISAQDLMKQALSKRLSTFDSLEPDQHAYPWNY